MMDPSPYYEANQREAELITARALVFDGYRYAQDHELTGPDDDWDFSGFIHDFLADPNFDLPRGHLHCALFLVQRGWIKEGWLRWDSNEARVTRLLFMELCRDDPGEYRNEGDWWQVWEARYKPDLDLHLAFVRERHEHAKYREQSAEGPW